MWGHPCVPLTGRSTCWKGPSETVNVQLSHFTGRETEATEGKGFGQYSVADKRQSCCRGQVLQL